MVDLKDEVLTQLEKHEETMRLDEFVRRVEIYHRDDGPGVERELLDAYAEAVYFEVDTAAIDDRLTDSDSWESGEHLYELADGRISDYPPDWHERLGDGADVRDVVEVLQNEVEEAEGDQREAVTDERGVPRPKVAWVGEAVAGIDPETTRDRLAELEENDEIETFASQNRDPTVRLT
ncbi:hypothetical protein [Halorussus ruber]|uniref:hypothetical protein n=1 Tax=Halorussus ruber TaxID=1126238 RepID=UPI001092675A|nr:hypothetical protein [Halorussus ruber]